MNEPVEVDYLEKGTFIGGEEDTSTAGIEYDETCYVLREANLRRIHNWLSMLSGTIIGGGNVVTFQEQDVTELRELITLTTISE